MHSPKFSHVIVDEAIAISEYKLDVVMRILLEFVIIPDILALHPQMRNDRVIIEFQDEMLAIPVDIREGLPY
jgi:hypothetical protein